MDCTRSHTLINQYIDAELDDAMVAESQAHVSLCADCAAELRDLSTLRMGLAGLGELEIDAPNGFADEVMAAVAALPALDLRDKLRELSERVGLSAVPAHRRAVALSAIAGLAAVAVGLEARHLRRHKRGQGMNVRGTEVLP
jgi:anti-sigma factor RsiW